MQKHRPLVAYPRDLRCAILQVPSATRGHRIDRSIEENRADDTCLFAFPIHGEWP